MIDFIDKYIESIGFKRVKGNTIWPVLPFFILDVMYQVYNKEIRPIKCVHEENKIKNLWYNSYKKLNSRFFSCFQEKEKIEIIDLMDEFENYINNDIVMVRVSIMNFLPKTMPHELRMIFSSAMICNILAQASKVLWNRFYKNKYHESIKNDLIESIEKLSYKWLSLFFNKRCSCLIDINTSEIILTNVDVLCKKIVNWANTQK